MQTTELADPERTTFIAADSAGQPIGYAMVRRNRTTDGVTGVAPGELQRIYVDRPWHGRGVGDALMTRCVEQARAWGCDAFWLGVWQQNPRAIAFYERSGFKHSGRRRPSCWAPTSSTTSSWHGRFVDKLGRIFASERRERS